MKRNIDIVIIITSTMFGVGISIMMAALICMAADVHVWHVLIPRAIVFIIGTAVVFVFSLAARHYAEKSLKASAQANQAENPHMLDKKTRASRFCGIAALVCFYIALSCIFASGFCNGLAKALTFLFSAIAAIGTIVLAIAWILIGKYSAGQKYALLYLISIPFVFTIIGIAIMAISAGAMLYIMFMVWAQWGVV